jgi:hypothetical protein
MTSVVQSALQVVAANAIARSPPERSPEIIVAEGIVSRALMSDGLQKLSSCGCYV